MERKKSVKMTTLFIIQTATIEHAVLTASNRDITILRVEWKMLQFHNARGEYSNSVIRKIKDNN